MQAINLFLKESYPDHPNDIVIRNSFYPKGLTSLEIYNHYQTYKNKILKWINNRYVSFFLNIDSKLIVKRKINNELIRLTNENFDTIINGRTNVIFVEYPSAPNYFVLDIDPGKLIPLSQMNKFVTYLSSHPEIKKLSSKIEIIRSSFTGAHIIGYTEIKTIENQRKDVIEALQKIDFSKFPIVINTKGRHPLRINIDLTSINNKGLHICKYSLTKEGIVVNDFLKPIEKII